MATLCRRGRASRPTPKMNVTPLVDVVLVLLIIFMIVIPAMDESLNLEVPSVALPDDSSPTDADEAIVLAVTAEGNVYVQERRVDPPHLTTALRHAHTRYPGRRLVLKGDRDAAYQHIRPLFAAAQAIGFPGISIRVAYRSAAAGTGQRED